MNHWIQAMGYSVKSPYNDGFVQWGVKQQLYQLKWLIDQQLNSSPKFSPEDEWLKEQEQQKIMQILTDETST